MFSKQLNGKSQIDLYNQLSTRSKSFVTVADRDNNVEFVHTSSSLVKGFKFSSNLLWLIFGGGAFFGLIWIGQAILCALTIIGIPVAIGCWRVGTYSLSPIGREPIDKSILYQQLYNPFIIFAIIIWLPFGIFWALSHALIGVFYCITIIGMPYGIAHLKIARIVLNPYFCEIVSYDKAKTIKQFVVNQQLNFRLEYPFLSWCERKLINKWAENELLMKIALWSAIPSVMLFAYLHHDLFLQKREPLLIEWLAFLFLLIWDIFWTLLNVQLFHKHRIIIEKRKEEVKIEKQNLRDFIKSKLI